MIVKNFQWIENDAGGQKKSTKKTQKKSGKLKLLKKNNGLPSPSLPLHADFPYFPKMPMSFGVI